MATFLCEALDAQGRTLRLEIEARDEAEAGAKIRGQNCYPVKILRQVAAQLGVPQAAVRRRGRFALGLRVRGKALSQFTRQFAMLLGAGLPIVRSLGVLHAQQKPGLLKETLAGVKAEVEGGSALSEALAKYPRVFDKLYVNMIRAGEAGGVLDQILSRLADYMEKSQRLKQKVLGALVYPAAVLTIAGGILSFILVYIIPRFEAMFREMGLALPFLTQLLIGLSTLVSTYWYVLFFAAFVAWAAGHFACRTPAGRYALDLFKLKLPVFGGIVSMSAVSRFCRTLGTLLQSGVPILNALCIIKDATGNTVVAGAIGAAHDSIREGDTIAEPLRHSGVFDDLVVNMIQVGEETGELDQMLIRVADNYDGEVDALVGALMSLLEPVLIIVMGVVVGFIVIALFLPLLTMTIGLSG
jgi:type IV pilus assembly protein PilC